MKLPTITSTTISREITQSYEWLSKFKNKECCLDANAKEVGLEWLASNRMLFYGLQEILKKHNPESFDVFSNIQQKFRTTFPDMVCPDLACFHIRAVINGMASKPHREQNNVSQAFGFTVPFRANFKGGNIVLHKNNTEIILCKGGALFLMQPIQFTVSHLLLKGLVML
jgi:hypothetical protein